jgi:hypothetical protein
MHAVVATDGVGTPLRVRCGYCDSEHNYRGGPRVDADTGVIANARSGNSNSRPPAPRTAPSPAAMPLVSERERTLPAVTLNDNGMDLEMLLRRIIREEAGLTATTPAGKWRGGTLVLRPADSSLQEKTWTWPIETFFHKVVMLRNRLRTLEQQVNASKLPEDEKIKLQSYITGCYGSLTSFNLLFADERDQFKGQGE